MIQDHRAATDSLILVLNGSAAERTIIEHILGIRGIFARFLTDSRHVSAHPIVGFGPGVPGLPNSPRVTTDLEILNVIFPAGTCRYY